MAIEFLKNINMISNNVRLTCIVARYFLKTPSPTSKKTITDNCTLKNTMIKMNLNFSDMSYAKSSDFCQ